MALRIPRPLLPWDGSHLGSFGIEVVIEEEKKGRFRYCKLLLPVWGLTSVILKPINIDMIIADELKAAFSMGKLGTHRANINRKECLLIRPNSSERLVSIKEKTLNEYHQAKYDRGFRIMVQEALVYRLLIQSFNHQECNIAVREIHGLQVPISINDKKLFHRDMCLSQAVQDRWFVRVIGEDGKEIKEISSTKVTRRMLGLGSDSTDEELENRLSRLRDDIEAAILRIDERKIWMAASIMSRVIQYLDYG